MVSPRTGYSTSPKSKSRPKPPTPLQGFAASDLSPPTTPDTSHERVVNSTHLTSSEVMSQQTSQSSILGSGASSPAKAGPGLNYISSVGNPQTSSRASLRPKPSPGSANSSLAQSRYSLYNTRPSPYGNSPSAASQSFGTANSLPSKHLITVIPPDCLPHDPPHPRANPQASGYGPPENFKRGVLLPLYPTLSGQLGAIAREYGLPSKGGLIVYLLELSTELVSDGPHQAFVGGPRISEEAWQLLWSRLFELEALQREEAYRQEEDTLDLSEGEDEEQHSANYSRGLHQSNRPPVPPVPEQHRAAAHHEERYSDQSSRDNSDAPSPDYYTTSMDAGNSLVSPPAGSSSRSMAALQQQPQRHSHGARSPPPTGHSSRPGSRASRRYDTFSQSRTRTYSASQSRPPTSQSMRSLRRQTATSITSSAAAAAAYGPSVIVGKLEFDIDRRRGAGRWYDAWIEQATNNAGPIHMPSSASINFNGPPYSSFNSPAYSSVASPVDTERRATAQRNLNSSSQNVNSDSHQPASRNGGGKAELYLPGLVNRKSHILQSMSPSSSTGSFPPSATIPAQPTLESLAREEESSLNLSIDSTKTSLAKRASSPSAVSESNDQESEVSASNQDYTQLADDDGSDYEESAAASVDLDRRQLSGIRISRSSSDRHSSASKKSQQRDPLSDVFGQDEATWKNFGESASQTDRNSGLGLGLGMPDVLGVRLTSEAEENRDSPIDEVREVKDLLSQRSSQRSSKRRSVTNALSSPIHLDQGQFAGPSVSAPSDFEASMPASEELRVSSTPPASLALAPTITRESPSTHEAQTSSVRSQAPSVTSVPERPQEEKDQYRPASPSKWSSFAALHTDAGTPTSASKTDDQNRESVEMDFDNLEKALAELSPKAMMRTGTNTSSKISSRRPSGTSPAVSPAFQTQSFSSAQQRELKKTSSRTSAFSAKSNTSDPNVQSPATSTFESPKLPSQKESPLESTAAADLPERPQDDKSEKPPLQISTDAIAQASQPMTEPQQHQSEADNQEPVVETASPAPPLPEKSAEPETGPEPQQQAPTTRAPPLYEEPRSPPSLPYMHSPPLPLASSMPETDATTPKSAQANGAPTTFEALLSPQSYVLPEAQPPARGSSLQHSLRKPWAARTSPSQQSPTQSQNGDGDTSSGSGGFMSKLFSSSRKNSSASRSEEQSGSGLSSTVTNKLQSPKERATPVFNNPPHHTSTLAQRRRGLASPPASPRFDGEDDDGVRHIDFAAQARAYFDSNSNDPLAGMRESPKAAETSESLR